MLYLLNIYVVKLDVLGEPSHENVMTNGMVIGIPIKSLECICAMLPPIG